MKLADAFTDKTRCYEEAFEIIESGEGQKSNGLFVYKWKNKEELYLKMQEALNIVFEFENVEKEKVILNDFQRMNVLFGLYDNGYVNNQGFDFGKNLLLENWQLLTPYRAGYFGTLGVNRFIQSNYRHIDKKSKDDKYFNHADKLIEVDIKSYAKLLML